MGNQQTLSKVVFTEHQRRFYTVVWGSKESFEYHSPAFADHRSTKYRPLILRSPVGHPRSAHIPYL